MEDFILGYIFGCVMGCVSTAVCLIAYMKFNDLRITPLIKQETEDELGTGSGRR